MIKKGSYDILIFSAREEEIWLIRQYFIKEKNIDSLPIDDLHNEIEKVEDYSGLQLGLISLSSMGNISAAIKSYEIIQKHRPKGVFMIGVAGAVPDSITQKGSLHLCDVGISSSINYYSFGKIENDDFFPAVRRNDIDDSNLHVKNGKLIKIIDEGEEFERKVNERIIEFWTHEDFNSSQWISECIKRDDTASYVNQKTPQDISNEKNKIINMSNISENDKKNICQVNNARPIKVDPSVSYASGEYVIANNEYLEKIYALYGANENIRMIDMESSGISRVCSKFRIPYLTIKAASDYAGHKKSDSYRFTAIAAASATCIELLKDKKVLNAFDGERVKHTKVWNCLIPSVEPECPEDEDFENQSDWRFRGCLDGFLKGMPTNRHVQVVDLSRVYENIKPIDYSEDLAKVLSYNNINERRLTFFFPYSGMDLLDFFAKEEDGDEILTLVAEIRKLELEYRYSKSTIWKSMPENSERKKELQQALVIHIKSLAKKFKNNYQHFEMMNEICDVEGLGKSMPDIARVIIFDGGKTFNDDDIINDPLNVVYPELLLTKVPTYYTTTGKLKGADVPFLDAIYIARKDGGERQYYTVLQYSDTAQTLMISGTPCQVVPDSIYKKDTKKLGTNDLYHKWINWRDNPKTDLFCEFPFRKILKEYSDYLP